MLESLRLRFKVWLTSRNQPQKPLPVNPYAQRLPSAERVPNPYAPSLDTKKQIGLLDALLNRKTPSTDPSMALADYANRFKRPESCDRTSPPVEVVPIGPTFFDDMKAVVGRDLLFVASKVTPKRRVTRTMTSDEIARACANIRWG